MTRAKPAAAMDGWFGLGLDMWMLGLESSSVIALRTMKMAAGGASADAEAQRMVSEKMWASMDLCQRAAFGQLGTSLPGIATTAVAGYRKKVRANQKRLTKR